AILAQRAVQLAVNPKDDVIVPLSGGLDSRGIATHLPPWVQTATAISYGHRRSLEFDYARETAHILGIPWKAYYLDRNHFRRAFLPVVERGGLMTHRMHCQMAGIASIIEHQDIVLLPGFMGDLVQGLR